MMVTVYVLTFEAQWREQGKIVAGTQEFPITLPSGTLDMQDAILACTILAAQDNIILYPKNGVRVNTVISNLAFPPIWDDADVRVY